MLLNQKFKQDQKQHPTGIYLEKCSTYNYRYNKEILTYAREGNIWLFGHCNTGTKSTNKKGQFSSIECWINT